MKTRNPVSCCGMLTLFRGQLSSVRKAALEPTLFVVPRDEDAHWGSIAVMRGCISCEAGAARGREALLKSSGTRVGRGMGASGTAPYAGRGTAGRILRGEQIKRDVGSMTRPTWLPLGRFA